MIAPVVKRKVGVSGLADLTLDATTWKNAYWAKEKGLYARVFENIADMDKELAIFTEKNPDNNNVSTTTLEHAKEGR